MEGSRYVKLMPPLDGIVNGIHERLKKLEQTTKDIQRDMVLQGKALAILKARFNKMEGLV